HGAGRGGVGAAARGARHRAMDGADLSAVRARPRRCLRPRRSGAGRGGAAALRPAGAARCPAAGGAGGALGAVARRCGPRALGLLPGGQGTRRDKLMRKLQSGRVGPQRADSMVVFVHGYGADGADLLGLAEPLAPHLPGTAFYAPDGPEASAVNPAGRQWFSIPWMDGSSPAEAQAGLLRSADDLNG